VKTKNIFNNKYTYHLAQKNVCVKIQMVSGRSTKKYEAKIELI